MGFPLSSAAKGLAVLTAQAIEEMKADGEYDLIKTKGRQQQREDQRT